MSAPPTRAEGSRREAIAWHDAECGAYSADLPLWRELADAYGAPILDVGAGTGRVALELARGGHRVTALDVDHVLLSELARRAGELEVSTAVADGRDFELGRRFALIIAPMQTVQLFGGPTGRARFLVSARRHLAPGGRLAVAISERLDFFDERNGGALPLPDILERDGVVYCSQATAVRRVSGSYLLERRRETVAPDGTHSAEPNVIHVDRVTAEELEREALAAGLRPAGRRDIEATVDHVGSVVVMLDG
jgi:SAM-dependent methyltransferase